MVTGNVSDAQKMIFEQKSYIPIWSVWFRLMLVARRLDHNVVV